MAVNVYVPTPFRRHTDGQARLAVEAGSVAELLRRLAESYPQLARQIMDERGQVAEYINVFVNQEEIRGLQGVDTALRDGDEVAFIPAMAGGTSDAAASSLDSSVARPRSGGLP